MKYFWTPNTRIRDTNGIANLQLGMGLDKEAICHDVRQAQRNHLIL